MAGVMLRRCLLVTAVLVVVAAGPGGATAFTGSVTPAPRVSLSRGAVPAAAGVVTRPYWADGYAWADQPTSASYAPNPTYAFNRTGGAIEITKPAGTTGRYLVRFTGLSTLLGSKSTVRVTAYFTSDGYCEPVGARLANDVVEVRCFGSSSGAPLDTYFTVLVTRIYADLAFAYAHQPTGNNYNPMGNASWNPGGATKVYRTGVGTYQVLFKGLGALLQGTGGHAQVGAVGTAQLHCKTVRWSSAPDILVEVNCFTAAGAPADSKFTVLFLTPTDHLTYAFADQPTATSSYTPSPFYSSNPTGGAISVTRPSLGRYTVSWTGVDPTIFDGGDVQVTAYGTGNVQCKVEGWGAASATVRCFSPGGLLRDSLFVVLLGS